MSTREQFEQSWVSRYNGDPSNESTPPNLACWNAEGELKSKEAVREELDRCKSRIAGLRRRMKDEEFLEAFCERCLGDFDSTNAVVMRSTYAVKSSGSQQQLNSGIFSMPPIEKAPAPSSEEHGMETHWPTIESLYFSPADSTEETPNNENPYSEPFVHTDHDNFHSEDIYTEPLVPQKMYELYAKPSELQLTKSTKSAKKRTNPYDEIFDVQSELTVLAATASDHEDESSEDDSLANMIAIRQSMCRVSQFCIDGGSTRQQLELQAARLSTRFSCMYDIKSSTGNLGIGVHLTPNDYMDTVMESSILPSISSSGSGSLISNPY